MSKHIAAGVVVVLFILALGFLDTLIGGGVPR